MRLALAAALVGAISLSITEHYRRPTLTPGKDPHDTLVAVPDSAIVPRVPGPGGSAPAGCPSP